MIYILVSSCDDCKLTLFSPSDKLDTFLEHFKKPQHLPAPTPHPAAEKEKERVSPTLDKLNASSPDVHELGNGVRLKRNTTASNPRTFTKIQTSTSTSTVTSSTTNPSSVSLPFLSIAPTTIKSELTLGSTTYGSCDILPYLIKNFTKFMNYPKTLSKVLSIFCVISWCADVRSLLWYIQI